MLKYVFGGWLSTYLVGSLSVSKPSDICTSQNSVVSSFTASDSVSWSCTARKYNTRCQGVHQKPRLGNTTAHGAPRRCLTIYSAPCMPRLVPNQLLSRVILQSPSAAGANWTSDRTRLLVLSPGLRTYSCVNIPSLPHRRDLVSSFVERRSYLRLQLKPRKVHRFTVFTSNARRVRNIRK